MNRAKQVVAALLIFALILLALSFSFIFPPASIQECFKVERGTSPSWLNIGSQSSYYHLCISSVAHLKKDKSLCRHISSSYGKEKCIEAVDDPSTRYNFYSYTGYGGLRSLSDHIYECSRDALIDEHYCRAVELAESGN